MQESFEKKWGSPNSHRYHRQNVIREEVKSSVGNKAVRPYTHSRSRYRKGNPYHDADEVGGGAGLLRITASKDPVELGCLLRVCLAS